MHNWFVLPEEMGADELYDEFNLNSEHSRFSTGTAECNLNHGCIK